MDHLDIVLADAIKRTGGRFTARLSCFVHEFCRDYCDHLMSVLTSVNSPYSEGDIGGNASYDPLSKNTRDVLEQMQDANINNDQSSALRRERYCEESTMSDSPIPRNHLSRWECLSGWLGLPRLTMEYGNISLAHCRFQRVHILYVLKGDAP